MKLKSTWGAKLKQWDKIDINVRVGAITVFPLNADWSDKLFSLSVANFKLTNK